MLCGVVSHSRTHLLRNAMRRNKKACGCTGDDDGGGGGGWIFAVHFFVQHPLLLSSSNYMLSPNWLCFCLSHWMTAFLWHTSYADFFTHTLSLSFHNHTFVSLTGFSVKKLFLYFLKGKNLVLLHFVYAFLHSLKRITDHR